MPTSRPLLAAVAAAAVAVAAAVALSASSASRTATTADGAAQPVAPTALLQGIPERDGVLGDPGAPITVTEFLDLQCPACAAAAATELPRVIAEDVRTGRVKLRAQLLHFLGPDSVKAAHVAAGAAAQDRLWPFVLAFYSAQGAENSGYVTDAFLERVAEAAGVDADAAAGFDGSAELAAANAAAARHGIEATPTFVVEREGRPARVVDAARLAAELAR